MNQDDKNNEEIDLSDSLKDSETGVESKNRGWDAIKYYHQLDDPKIIQWTIKYSGGLIKDTKQASYVLSGIVVLVIIISLFLIFSGGDKVRIEAPPGQKVIYPQDGPPRLQ